MDSKLSCKVAANKIGIPDSPYRSRWFYCPQKGRFGYNAQIKWRNGFENTEYFQKRVKDRYKIEGKNAELKIKHGYAKSWSKNFEAMTLQGKIMLFCVNLKRIQKLSGGKWDTRHSKRIGLQTWKTTRFEALFLGSN